MHGSPTRPENPQIYPPGLRLKPAKPWTETSPCPPLPGRRASSINWKAWNPQIDTLFRVGTFPSRDDLRNDVSVHVGEAIVAPLEAVGQAGVVDA